MMLVLAKAHTEQRVPAEGKTIESNKQKSYRETLSTCFEEQITRYTS